MATQTLRTAQPQKQLFSLQPCTLLPPHCCCTDWRSALLQPHLAAVRRYILRFLTATAPHHHILLAITAPPRRHASLFSPLALYFFTTFVLALYQLVRAFRSG
jgi:hypothetical protein